MHNAKYQMCQRQASTFLIFMSTEFKYMPNKLCLEGTVSKKFDGANQKLTLKNIYSHVKVLFIFEKNY